VIYLDTHIALAVMLGDLSEFSRPARQALDLDDELLISPMVLLEIEYLHEIRRLKRSARDLVEGPGAEVGLRVCNYSFDLVVEFALSEKWTRDLFDRVIVAHARARKASLITKDELIRSHYAGAVW
jgi:PIN domain nuclease of toxin-antitoxin system